MTKEPLTKDKLQESYVFKGGVQFRYDKVYAYDVLSALEGLREDFKQKCRDRGYPLSASVVFDIVLEHWFPAFTQSLVMHGQSSKELISNLSRKDGIYVPYDELVKGHEKTIEALARKGGCSCDESPKGHKFVEHLQPKKKEEQQ